MSSLVTYPGPTSCAHFIIVCTVILRSPQWLASLHGITITVSSRIMSPVEMNDVAVVVGGNTNPHPITLTASANSLSERMLLEIPLKLPSAATILVF